MKQLVHYYRTENRSNFHTKYKIFFPRGNALWVNGLIALKCFLCLPDDLVLLIVDFCLPDVFVSYLECPPSVAHFPFNLVEHFSGFTRHPGDICFDWWVWSQQ